VDQSPENVDGSPSSSSGGGRSPRGSRRSAARARTILGSGRIVRQHAASVYWPLDSVVSFHY
jgi:hypothetical protein